MKNRRTQHSLSMSFLDILACALGGVLMLFLVSSFISARNSNAASLVLTGMTERMSKTLGTLDEVTSALEGVRQENEGFKRALSGVVEENRELLGALESLRADHQAAEAALANARKNGETSAGLLARAESQIDALRRASDTLRQAQANLVGLRGPLHNVVFVFDTSGSMKTPRFGEYKGTLKSWISFLPLSRLAVIDFDNKVRTFRSGFIDATLENRQAACTFVDAFKADGTTDTLAALKAAFALEGIDTVVLLSDGEPTAPLPRGGGRASPDDIRKNIELVEKWLKENNSSGKVAINCVAMGNYFNTAYGEFLQRIARDHDGMFIGR